MALFDWVNSNLHNNNQDWIISKIKTVESSETSAKAAAESAEESKTTAINAAASAAASAASADNSAAYAAGALDLYSEVAADLQTLEARMDTFTNLPTGSTSGDAELQDIRVPAVGGTYSTAGDAVRSQASASFKTSAYDYALLLKNEGRVSTSAGVRFEYIAREAISITGSSTGTSFISVIDTRSALPPGFEAGKPATFKIEATSSNISATLYEYNNSAQQIARITFRKTKTITLLPDCTGFYYRVNASGSDLNDEANVGIWPGRSAGDLSSETMQAGLNVLVLGNSYSYSDLSYTASLIREIMPDMPFTMGICYDSGQSMQGHYNRIINNTAYAVFSKYNSQLDYWANNTNITFSQIITDSFYSEPWDVIILQQNSSNSYKIGTYELWLRPLFEAVKAHLVHPAVFMFNASHAWGSNDPRLAQNNLTSDSMALQIMACARYVDESIPLEAVIPSAIAVQNARQIDELEALGSYGSLCCDVNSHLQNGLPCLIPAYAAAYKLLKYAGKKAASYGWQLKPTDQLLDDLNLYTYDTVRHGLCVGITDDNLQRAMDAAAWAIKRPSVITKSDT